MMTEEGACFHGTNMDFKKKDNREVAVNWSFFEVDILWHSDKVLSHSGFPWAGLQSHPVAANIFFFSLRTLHLQ